MQAKIHQNQNKYHTIFMKNEDTTHIPVLTKAVLLYLDPQATESYLDATAGYGGHAKEVIGRTLSHDRDSITLIDRDQNAINVLKDEFGESAEIIHSDFLQASKALLNQGKSYDLILADLGVSSPHLNNASRGFSFSVDGPLDMRMDTKQELTAETIINSFEQSELELLIRRFGEEPKAKTIARYIVENRPIKTTKQLADVVGKAWRGNSRTNPATRTFQAVRIAVNDELGQLEQALVIWKNLLAPGGRLAVISFHSLEDRVVKHFFAEHSGGYDSEFTLLTPKPVMADENELVFNPRARSAKLRAVAKIKINKGKGD